MPDITSIGRAMVMPFRSSRRRARATLLRTIRKIPDYLRLLYGTLRDSRVSLIDRTLVVVAIGYVLSPFDFVPDVIPFFGQVDDVFLIAVALNRLFERAPRRVILRHWDGEPEELSVGSMTRLLYAASFFLPLRTRLRLRGMARG